MKMRPRPSMLPVDAFKKLKYNGFYDLELPDGSTVAIEPGMTNAFDNMLVFVPNGKWLETYGVHSTGKRWCWVT
jgi:hypothetical protein